MSDSSGLHLPDLTIKGFRGIDELTIPRLGRVTLLVGKNGVGKTTVLDAVRVYAARGRRTALQNVPQCSAKRYSPLLMSRGETRSRPIGPLSFIEGNSARPELRLEIGGSQVRIDSLRSSAAF